VALALVTKTILSLARAIWSLVYGLWHPRYYIIFMMSIRYAMHSILVVGHMVLGILQIVFQNQEWNIVHAKDQKIDDHIANVCLFVI
jgi:hypothetical protein